MLLFLGAWLGVGAMPGVAVAQNQRSAVDIAQARELLNDGLKLGEQGDAKNALEKLKAAHALANTPITGLALGRMYVAVGKLVEARETFLSVDRIAVQPEETARSTTARKESARLAEQIRLRIPSLTVRVTGVSADSVAVTIDGAAVPAEALAAPRLLDPGSHDVFARSTSGGTAETKIDLREGEARDVELKIVFAGGAQSPAGPPASPPPTIPLTPMPLASHATESMPSGGPLRPLAWSLMGVGAVVGVAGTVLLIVESAKAKDANNSHDQSAYDSASAAWTIGLVGSIVGAAGLAGGAIALASAGGSAGPRQPLASIWLDGGVSGLRLGGTW